MSGRRKASFTVTDVHRAIAGVKKAGFDVARCEINPDGTISVVTMAGAMIQAPKAEPAGQLARWLAEEAEDEAAARRATARGA